jgi:hypothetical protein
MGGIGTALPINDGGIGAAASQPPRRTVERYRRHGSCSKTMRSADMPRAV